MTKESNEHSEQLEIYKLVIADEHHYRTMLQSRINFNSGIVIALIGLIGAGAFEATGFTHYVVLIFLSCLITFVSIMFFFMVKRIYEHFHETIRRREALERLVGLRTQNDEPEPNELTLNNNDNSDNYWRCGFLYYRRWAQLPKNVQTRGYFAWATRIFYSFAVIGVVLSCVFAYLAFNFTSQSSIASCDIHPIQEQQKKYGE